MASSQPSRDSLPGAAAFPTTQWTAVVTAGDRSSPEARQAMAQLCRKYWYPLYVFVRRQGPRAEDAQDLTQAFFAHLLERNCIAAADPHRGRFRTFLLASLKHFMIDQWQCATAAKRGGNRTVISLDAQVAEDRYRCEPADDLTPERVYEQRWAVALLDAVMERLQQEYVAAGRAVEFDAIKRLAYDMDGSVTYADIVAQLNMTEGALKTAVYRVRIRLAQMVRSEIAQTVVSLDEVDDEIRQLFASFG